MMVADKKNFNQKWVTFIEKIDSSFKQLLAEKSDDFAIIKTAFNQAKSAGFIDKLFCQIVNDNYQEAEKALTLVINELDFVLNAAGTISAFKLIEIADIILQSLIEVFALSSCLKRTLEVIHAAKTMIQISSSIKVKKKAVMKNRLSA